MRRSRVYSDQALEVGCTLALEPGPARHLVRVLRLGVGDSVVVFNGDGSEYDGTIGAVEGKDQCRVELTRRRQPTVESPLAISLFQAIARGEKMDWCIQKAVELGVSRIQPLFSERTEVRLSEARASKRLAHWQQVVIAACEQSGRVRVPEVLAPVDLDALDNDIGLSLVLDPRSPSSLAALTRPTPPARIGLLVGPEGGLSATEIERLLAHGWTGIRLGPRTLRTETAGVAALAIIQALWGDSG